MKILGIILITISLISITQSFWTRQISQEHQYTPAVSSAIAEGIKKKLIDNIGSFTNQDFAQTLLKDLNQPDDSKRKLDKIDNLSATQLFSLFKIHNPNCDSNKDNQISGQQLKCLNIIWKFFVPEDQK